MDELQKEELETRAKSRWKINPKKGRYVKGREQQGLAAPACGYKRGSVYKPGNKEGKTESKESGETQESPEERYRKELPLVAFGRTHQASGQDRSFYMHEVLQRVDIKRSVAQQTTTRETDQARFEGSHVLKKIITYYLEVN